MLGLRRALVVHGRRRLDEITITAATRISEVRDGTSAPATKSHPKNSACNAPRSMTCRRRRRAERQV